MKRGPKLKQGQGPAVAKRLVKVDIATSCAAPRSPIMPDYLADVEAMEPARTVWLENIERVTANGCHEGDSDLFARYCIQEAGYRAHVARWLAGEEGFDSPQTSRVESLRKMAELLGIAGPSSRQRLGSAKLPSENTFARNGQPPRN